MKNSHSSLFCLFTFLCLCLSLNLAAQTTLTYYNQSFVIDTLYPAAGSAGMYSPWEVFYGPDDSLGVFGLFGSSAKSPGWQPFIRWQASWW